MDDYRTNGFDVECYLSTRYSCPGSRDDFEHQMRDFSLHQLHQFFQSQSTAPEFKVLDYACGPVVANVISAARVATEIVFAEYTEEGRSAVQQWIDKDPNAFDWSPYFEYIVQTLEDGSQQDAQMREKRVRNITKAVVNCDIAQDPPISINYVGPYDVVICCLSIGHVSKTNEDFEREIFRLAGLVKSGKHLLLQLVESKDMIECIGRYPIGDKMYSKKRVNCAYVQALLEKYFDEITVNKVDAVANPSVIGTMIFTAHKK